VLSHCGDGGGGDFDYGTVPQTSNFGNLGPLLDADANGLRLPAGFTSRIVARSGELVEGTSYTWHGSPDGAATFPLPDGGYIYTSNSEIPITGMGGAGAIRFDKKGKIRDAYRILDGTVQNCGGGPTPWGTWMSGEEVATGQIHECDPHGVEPSVAWPMLGAFQHEAIAFDPATLRAYLTEDNPEGRFYRFTPAGTLPNGRPDLSSGTLEAMRVVTGTEGAVVWETIADPTAATTPTRMQAPTSTAFNGGEGIWCFDGIVYFTTKGDNRVWAHDIAAGSLEIIYDAGELAAPILTGVDNITVTAGGDVLVVEDGGDMQVIVITPAGAVLPVAQIMGHAGSEVTGIALDPHRKRLYFSSQRGAPVNLLTGGITYEVTGPFFV
jgi:secreted PhoX family phosphatase